MTRAVRRGVRARSVRGARAAEIVGALLAGTSRAALGVGALVAVAAASTACGASNNGGVPFVAIRPEDARLAAAANNLSASVGHDLEYEVDAAVLKEHAAELQDRLSDALETIARGLEGAREQSPDDVARTCATLKALRVELDEKIRDHRAVIVNDVLVLRVPTKVASFATDAAVRQAFLTAE